MGSSKTYGTYNFWEHRHKGEGRRGSNDRRKGGSQFLTPKGATIQGGSKGVRRGGEKDRRRGKQTLMEEGGRRELTSSPSPNRELEG